MGYRDFYWTHIIPIFHWYNKINHFLYFPCFIMITIKFKKLIFWIILFNKFYNFGNEIKVSLQVLKKIYFLCYSFYEILYKMICFEWYWSRYRTYTILNFHLCNKFNCFLYFIFFVRFYVSWYVLSNTEIDTDHIRF